MSVDNSYIIEETKTKDELDKIIEDLSAEVDRLYFFRDHYFENHPLEKAVNKESDVKNKLESTIRSFEKCEESPVNGHIKANFLYLKGRALNILPAYDQKAVQALSKAVKLDPNLVDAWNELGECYWKDNNLPEAKNCFNGALPHKRNKISLRNMSIVLRQEVSLTSQERHKNIEKSVELAKEAVQLDPKDGVSWCILGNAYLCSFFVIAQDPAILKLCMSSYKQALTDPVARGQADLHYNRAVALMYEEDFPPALESFTKAMALDPTWEDPSKEMQKLASYLDELVELIKTRGKIKGKRLQQMIQQLTSKQMGPYSDGKYTIGSHSISLRLTPLSELKVEMNPEIVVLGKVVCSVRNERTVPFTFCIVDSQGTCMAVTVYNLANGKGVIIGDSIAIPEPFVTKQSFTHDAKEYHISSIRVDNPMVMVVNGKKVGKDQMAGTRITSSYKVS